MLYGAIIGDIAGSRFEFDRGPWTKDFEMFIKGASNFTDDTVLTVAIAQALKTAGKNAPTDAIRYWCVESIKYWAGKYPAAGYGAMFREWLQNPVPYNSFGNGSAMRVSAVGWMYEDLDRVREVARATAEISHNHPEGIKGAEAVATAIWMAVRGFNKFDILTQMVEEFDYDLSKTVAGYTIDHKHDETCMDSVPRALVAFGESTSFEDAIRNAVSMGGDADTVGAITGSIAEAYYGVPVHLKRKCEEFLMSDILREVKVLEAEI